MQYDGVGKLNKITSKSQ